MVRLHKCYCIFVIHILYVIACNCSTIETTTCNASNCKNHVDIREKVAACDSLPPEDQGLCLDNVRKKVDAEIAIRAEERLFEMLQLERARVQLENERVQLEKETVQIQKESHNWRMHSQLESECVQLQKKTVRTQKESHNWAASGRNAEIYVFGSAVDKTSESSVFSSFLTFAFVFSGVSFTFKLLNLW